MYTNVPQFFDGHVTERRELVIECILIVWESYVSHGEKVLWHGMSCDM